MEPAGNVLFAQHCITFIGQIEELQKNKILIIEKNQQVKPTKFPLIQFSHFVTICRLPIQM